MGFFTRAACGGALSSALSHHTVWLVMFGLALATFDFLDGFAWLRRGFLRLRAGAYAAIRPSLRPLSAGDYWLTSVILLVAALAMSVTMPGGAGAPIRFFLYATLGLAVILRLYLVVYAIEKGQLTRPPRRTADRLLARLSTAPTVAPEYSETPASAKRSPATGALTLLVLGPLTYLWQTAVGLLSVVIWLLYSPILVLALIPGKLVGLTGVAIALAAALAPKVCG